MKILIIGPAWPLRGGLATFDERLARAFAESGDQADILTFKLQYPNFLFPGTTQYSTSPAPESLNIDVRLNSVNPFNWLQSGLRYDKMRYDRVLIRYWLPFMGPCLGTVARLLKRNGHTRVIALTDNVIPHEKRPGDLPFTKYFLGGCDAFITMSEKVLGDLEGFAPSKPKKYLPHPLYDNFGESVPRETALAKLGLNPDFKYVLFFGFIRAYKGLDLLLEAFGEERLKQSNIKLIIAGEYYEKADKYEEIIRDKGLESKIVRKTDFIADEDVRFYFCASDLVAQTYRHATQSGVSQIAYHFGKPMVVTNVGGLPELIPDGKAGYVVPPDPVEIADAVLRYFSENRQQEFEANMMELKKAFSWVRMTEAVKAL